MEMIYNSPNFCVVEFKDLVGPHGGFEIMDKSTKREMFLEGPMAIRFRSDVTELIALEPSTEEVDDFLSQFGGLMHHPLILH